MKGFLLCSACFLLACLPAVADPASFTDSLSTDELRALGLDQLNPQQRRLLDEKVKAYREGQLHAAEEAAQQARSAQQRAEAEAQQARVAQQAAVEEVKQARAESTQAKASEKGFWQKAKVLVVPGTKIEYAEIRSTIQGKFEGWEGRTRFILANGQTWQVYNADERYFTPAMENVEVEIRPAPLGGFWMYLPKIDRRVRVKLVGQR